MYIFWKNKKHKRRRYKLVLLLAPWEKKNRINSCEETADSLLSDSFFISRFDVVEKMNSSKEEFEDLIGVHIGFIGEK